MRRQLERKKRERETVDPLVVRLIELIGENAVEATAPEAQNGQDRLRVFLSKFVREEAPGRIQGACLDSLCLAVGCSADDVVRIARTVPRSASSHDCVFVDELSFAVLKVLAPVDVRERRRTACVGEVNETSSSIIPFYKARFSWSEKDDWAAFLQSLSTPLPMTFRLHCSEPSLTALAKYHVSQPPLAEVVEQVSIFRAAVASDANSPLQVMGCSHEAYHNDAAGEMWARTLHAASCVSFQEVVSALPVAALNPHRGGAVLDMCAAPGSKSLQALDCILRHGWDQTANSVVWLNEKDRTKATQTLPARLKRYHAPNLIITRCDATQLPRMYLPSSSGTTETQQPELKEKRFDFIVCDVPCSGDGTIRKERSVLSSWSTKYVESLVPTQKSLLRRAIDLLAIGGVVVYSTCSLNPAEDEEVVAAALSTFGSAVELLDVNALLQSNLVEGLQSAGGISVPIGEVDSENGMLDASKVLRVFPHRNDTGGFFIAALRKIAFPNMSPPTVIQSKLNQWMNHRRWVKVPHAVDTHWRCIMDFFGIDASAEAALLQHFRPIFNVNPNGGPQRRIVFVTPAVEEMVFEARPFKGPGVELIAIGMRAFEVYDGKYMQGSPCNWRAVTESASRVARFATRRKIVLNASIEGEAHLLKGLLSDGQISMETFCQHHADAFDDPVWWTTLTDGPRVVISGSVLLGVCGGPAKLAGDTIWWLSCTINRSKMELAVDESMRTFGLLSFFGISGDRNAHKVQVLGDDDAVVTAEETA